MILNYRYRIYPDAQQVELLMEASTVIFDSVSGGCHMYYVFTLN